MQAADLTSQERLGRRRRSMLWAFFVIVTLSMLLPTSAYLFAPDALAQETTGQGFGPDNAVNPRSETWREARQGVEGFTAASGPYTTNTLISNIGQNWRQLRTGPVARYGAYGMGVALAVIVLFFLIRGRIRIEGGRTGMVVPRWSAFERTVHWTVAISFIILTITGLSMLFGRAVLIPLMGAEAFAAYAQVAITVHNYLGPVFGVALLVMFLMWIKNNLPERSDWTWFKVGGGLIGKGHPPAGKANAGEKVWFWLGVFLIGGAVVATGLILDMPQWGQTREVMAWSNLIHAALAMVWIAFALGHIYIGTLGTEGSLEGMTRGKVDVNWAKQHHDLWYEELATKGVRPEPADTSSGRSGHAPAEARPGTA